MGVKIIPKTLISLPPIWFQEDLTMPRGEGKVDVDLIDGHPILRLVWEVSARKNPSVGGNS